MHDGENAWVLKYKEACLGAAFCAAYCWEVSCPGTAVRGY